MFHNYVWLIFAESLISWRLTVGLYAGVALVFRPPTAAADLPAGRQVEKLMLKLRNKVEIYSSCPSLSWL